MKRILFIAVLAIAFSNCSKIEIADDPVLGIWQHNLQIPMEAEGIEIDAEEWIFNDLYKGRFHGYKDGEIVYEMDYHWNFENGGYSLIYNGGDLEEIQFQLQEDLLVDMKGNVVAARVR